MTTNRQPMHFYVQPDNKTKLLEVSAEAGATMTAILEITIRDHLEHLIATTDLAETARQLDHARRQKKGKRGQTT